MNVKIEESWKRELGSEFESDYFRALAEFVRRAYRSGVCYPPGAFIFEAFNRTPFDRVKAVIVGQDPYHGPRQAHGLCFSVIRPTPPPPSLLNIYTELEQEYGVKVDRTSGDLSSWADQGVLLLNSTLTVAEHAPMSHQGHGWERFTDAVIKAADEKDSPVVFMLWGNRARAKKALLENKKHLVLEAAHPSPLARGAFFGCKHFSKANDYLSKNGVTPIDWQIESV